MMAFYVHRSSLIAKELTDNKAGGVTEADYRSRAPYPWLDFSADDTLPTGVCGFGGLRR